MGSHEPGSPVRTTRGDGCHGRGFCDNIGTLCVRPWNGRNGRAAMNRERVGKKPLEHVFGLTALLFILFLIGETDLAAAEYTLRKALTAAAWFAGLAALALPAVRLTGGLQRRVVRCVMKTGLRGALILFFAAAVPRLAWWAAQPAQVVSDYSYYVRLGAEYAAAGTLARDPYLLAIAPNVPLFAAVLGLLMRLFGPTALTAQWFCMVLHIGNIFLLYGIGRRLSTPGRAFLAAFLFALLPDEFCSLF